MAGERVDVETHTATVSRKVKGIRRDWGIFFTPLWVVDFMVGLIEEERLSSCDLRILEPACGICQFLHRIRENRGHLLRRSSRRVGVEINREVVDYVHANGLDRGIEIVQADYLLWETGERFDIIIGNPPYGIPSLSKHYPIKVDGETKRIYRKTYETWYGKYNVYGAFIEKSVKLLREGGQLILIVPGTFLILDEFKKLRKFLAERGKTEVVYMGSGVFKPEADVTTVILRFTKSAAERNRLLLYDHEGGKLRLITEQDGWTGGIVLFSTAFSREMDRICSFRVGDVYSIKVSPRTPEIRHNPEVVRSERVAEDRDLLPILNGRNLKAGRIIYRSLTGYWIEKDKRTKLRRFFDRPRIVVGLGFRGNGQVGAAYDYRAYPWMGDVYHMLRKEEAELDLSDEEVAEFLGSDLIRRYIKDVFRDITYHLSITQLRILPLPRRNELRRLKEVMESWR